jgi:hypothetical protein
MHFWQRTLLASLFFGCALAAPLAADDLLPPEKSDRRSRRSLCRRCGSRRRASNRRQWQTMPTCSAARCSTCMGRPPTAAEVKAYQQNNDPAKRRELVERLMASPAFAREQAAAFNALLMNGTNASLRTYLTEAFRENRSWDRIFRELLVGQENDAEQKGRHQLSSKRASKITTSSPPKPVRCCSA